MLTVTTGIRQFIALGWVSAGRSRLTRSADRDAVHVRIRERSMRNKARGVTVSFVGQRIIQLGSHLSWGGGVAQSQWCGRAVSLEVPAPPLYTTGGPPHGTKAEIVAV